MMPSSAMRAMRSSRCESPTGCANSGSIGCLHSEGSGRPIGAATRTYWPAADFSDRHLHGLLFACRDDRGRPCQPRFAIWPCLPRQIEHRGLDLLPRGLVCSCEAATTVGEISVMKLQYS